MRGTVGRCLLVVVLASAISRPATGGQLLSSPLKPLLNALNTTICSLPLVVSSPKADAAVRDWARKGGPGQLRVIASVESGLIGTARNLILGLGGLLYDDLPGINAIVAQVDGVGLAALTCKPWVTSISVDAI